jgi:putative ABC transport system permease protein
VQEVDVREGSREIVGIAADTKFLFPTESPRGAIYLPQRDASAQFVVRTTGSPAAALADLSAVARTLDPNLPSSRHETMEERIRRMVNLRRAALSLLGVLAALTLALATVGIYGVAANNVSTRTREIGIRMALGARGSQVLRMIVREQLPLTLIGVAVGIVLGLVGSTLLASFLFGVTPTDGLTFAGASAILGLVSLAASSLAARRAARLDPLVALRRE